MKKTQKNITVTGCKDCPFCKEHDMAPSYGCRLFTWDTQPEPIKQSKKWEPITPKWCPLKTEFVVVNRKPKKDIPPKPQHVIAFGNGWAVKSEENKRVTVVTETKQEAVQIASMIAHTSGAKVIIHDRTGWVEKVK